MKKFLLITAFSLAGAGMAAAQSATMPADATTTATPDSGAAAGAGMSPAETTTTTNADGTTVTTTAPAAGMGDAAAPMGQMAPQDFVDKAASGGMFEVQSSELAMDRSQNQSVKDFAQKMIDDHTKANDELKSIAESKSLTVPAEIAGPPAQHMEAVQAAEGDDFDKTYMQHQMQAHQETIDLFEAEAQNGQDAELQAFAEKTLPTLKEHAEMAKSVMTD